MLNEEMVVGLRKQPKIFRFLSYVLLKLFGSLMDFLYLCM